MTAGPQPLVGNFRNATVLPGRNNFDETLIDQVLNNGEPLPTTAPCGEAV
jgi:hypothetical protein